MNIKLLLVGVVVIVLLVAFGRNPMEERRKEKAESMKGKDMLVESIKEHNSKRRMPKMGSNSGGILGTRSSGSTGGAPARTRTSPQYPSYLMKPDAADGSAAYGQNPFTRAPSSRAASGGASASGAQDQNTPQSSSYYPPPPLPEKNKQPGPEGYVPGPGSGLGGVKLPSGQPLFFSGPQIFTVNAKGKTVPMPDGFYTLADSQIRILVKNGRKIHVDK